MYFTILTKRITRTTKGVRTPPAVLPLYYDVNAHCELHSGTPEHSIENSHALKYKVQDLIYSKETTFASNGLDVNNNPMPSHNKVNVNMVELDDGKKVITSVNDLKTPVIEIKHVLMKSDGFQVCTNTYEHCFKDPQQCEVLKAST